VVRNLVQRKKRNRVDAGIIDTPGRGPLGATGSAKLLVWLRCSCRQDTSETVRVLTA
jgi:hypothetical protein